MSRNPKGVVLGLVLVAAVVCLTQSPEIDFQNQTTTREHPVMNLPRFLRQRNWGSGSCVVASMVSLLRWQGRFAMANHLKANYSGGQWYTGWKAILDREGIKYASTRKKFDVAFLEKAVATRRGCMVTVDKEAHMVCLVDLTSTRACILDNNSPEKYIWVDRKEFLDEWKAANSWALTPVYTPTSPRIPR